MPQSP